MTTKKELRKTRLEKLKAVEKARLSPFPSKTKRTHTIQEALDNFSKLLKQKKEIVLTGRIRAQRTHGKATFIDIEDNTGEIQGFLGEASVGPKGYKFFLDNFDIGDFIELKGVLFLTKKEERTIKTRDFKMLAKSLLPLPDKWHGLKDVEGRYRKRYLDLLFSEEVREKFKIRSEVIKEIRSFLEKKDFLEVETPILQPIYGGATARPFKTHLNALNMDLYLRISPELYLKRLMVGGLEKVYEIGKCFRNEGMDKSHNPDFTMLEFYQAYADYKDLMKTTEEMFETILKKVFGKLKIEYNGKKIDFRTPWPRVEFSDLLAKYADIKLEEIHVDALRKEAKKLDITLEKGDTKANLADKIYKKCCQSKIIQPTFIIHHPLGSAPLAKASEDNPLKLERFQLVVAGFEIVNAFSELNDPIEQKKRFKEQEKIFKEGFEEAQRMDKDFIEALEYGMPPTAGFGMGIDRLVALLTDSNSLREVILFPTMKPKDKK